MARVVDRVEHSRYGNSSYLQGVMVSTGWSALAPLPLWPKGSTLVALVWDESSFLLHIR